MGPLIGNGSMEKSCQKFIEIFAPGNAYGCGSQCIFQHQIPSYNPRNKFSHGGIAVCICASGNRNHRSEFGIAQSCQRTANTGNNKTDSNRRARIVGSCGSCTNEQACANDSSYSKRYQAAG